MSHQSLEHQFLIAMPSQAGTYFGNTITYLCMHDEHGAFGLMVNRPTDLSLTELLAQMRCPTNVDPGVLVLEGGPVEPERGFVLHTNDVVSEASQPLSHDLALSTSKDVLDQIGEAAGPERFVVALGYAGWGGGQLEQEVAENAWLTCPASLELLFDTHYETKIDAAAASLGIDFKMMSSQAGQA